MNRKAEIKISIELDKLKIPQKLSWEATDSESKGPKKCKAFLLNLWEPGKGQTLSMNLWENSMSIPEMNDFVFQSLVQIADTYEKATDQKELAEKIRNSALEVWESTNEGKSKK